MYQRNLNAGDRIFPICYSTVRSFIKRLGYKVNVRDQAPWPEKTLGNPCERNGIRLEVISRVILRHSDLKTSQMYLDNVTDTEAIRRMDVLYNR